MVKSNNRRVIIGLIVVIGIVVILSLVFSEDSSGSSRPNKHQENNPGPSPGHSPGESPPSEVAKEFLDAHNKYRAIAGVPPLEWDDNLARWAKAWGDHVVEGPCARSCMTPCECHPGQCPGSSSDEPNQYLNNDNWGQNLAQFGGGNQGSPLAACAGWFNECQYYNPSNPAEESHGEVGHYTQMVWKSTTKVGCAVSECGDGSGKIYTCNYSPAGNVIYDGGYGEYAKNVSKKCS